MADENAIQFKRRGVSSAERSLISLSDLKLTALLPPLFASSWALPERHWPRVCETLVGSRNSAVEDAIARGVRFSGLESELTVPAADISHALQVHRYLSYLQYLRDYRAGGWQCSAVLEGADALQSARAKGHGVILWIAHFVYNGLPLKKAMHEAGLHVFHMSRPEHGFSDTAYGIRLLNPLRSHVEERYLARRIMIKRGAEHVALREAHRLLNAGSTVSITAGHWEGRQIAGVPVGDAVLPVSVGAPSLAHSTGAPLLPVFIRRDDDGVFRVRIGADLSPDRSVSRPTAVSAALAGFSEQLLSAIKLSPVQWRGWKYLTSRT